MKVYCNSYCEAASSHFLLVGMYRPPQAPFDKFDDCLCVIRDFIDNVQNPDREAGTDSIYLWYAGQHVAGHYRRNTERLGQTGRGDEDGLLNSIITV